MRILTRYILWEVTIAFLATLVSMTVFVFLALIGKEAVEKGLGLAPILRMLPYMVPQAMQFAVPGALLLATTSVYGRISSANEIVATKSLGISPMTFIWPTLALACVLSLTALTLNDIAMSWGRGGIDRVVVESLEEIAYGRLRTVRSFNTNKLSVNVKGVDGRRLVEPYIHFKSTGGGKAALITADYAELRADSAQGAVTIKLVNPQGDLGDWSFTHPGEFERSFPLDEFTGHSRDRTPSQFALYEIGPSKIEHARQIETLKHEMAADAGAALLLGRIDDLSQAQWQGREWALVNAERILHRLNTEPYRRWANGFSCLGFVMIGAPMAIRRRHAEFWGSFFACFLPILLVYYPMLVGCADKAKDGVLPPQAVWTGNMVLAAWGVWLMRRVIRF